MLKIERAGNGWIIEYEHILCPVKFVHHSFEDAIECVTNLMKGKVAEKQPSS